MVQHTEHYSDVWVSRMCCSGQACATHRRSPNQDNPNNERPPTLGGGTAITNNMACNLRSRGKPWILQCLRRLASGARTAEEMGEHSCPKQDSQAQPNTTKYLVGYQGARLYLSICEARRWHAERNGMSQHLGCRGPWKRRRPQFATLYRSGMREATQVVCNVTLAGAPPVFSTHVLFDTCCSF